VAPPPTNGNGQAFGHLRASQIDSGNKRSALPLRESVGRRENSLDGDVD
jgi:hypothetical protein